MVVRMVLVRTGMLWEREAMGGVRKPRSSAAPTPTPTPPQMLRVIATGTPILSNNQIHQSNDGSPTLI